MKEAVPAVSEGKETVYVQRRTIRVLGLITLSNKIVDAFLVDCNLVVPVGELEGSSLEFEILVRGFQVTEKGGPNDLLFSFYR